MDRRGRKKLLARASIPNLNGLRRLGAVSYRMVRQSQWLLLLVMLWPFGVAGILLARGSSMQADDILPILHQEAFYGMAMVAAAASTQLSKEERSRRILEVLSRSVSRNEYILMLGFVAWVPLVAYVCSFTLCARLLAYSLNAPASTLVWFSIELLVAGFFVAGAGLFFAVLLPATFATGATFAVAAAATLAGNYGLPGPPGIMYALGSLRLQRGDGASVFDLIATIAAAAGMCAAACACFRRRDLRLGE